MKNHFLTFMPEIINMTVLECVRYLGQMPFLLMVSFIIGFVFLIMTVLYFLIKNFCRIKIDFEGVCMANELNAAIYSLIMALIIIALFNFGQKTDDTVSNEAINLLFVLRDSEKLSNRSEIQEAVKNYIDIVIHQQWLLMTNGQLDEAKMLTQKTINPLYQVIQRADPKGIVQRSFYAALPNILSNLDKTQKTRLELAGTFLPIEFWRILNCMLVFVLAFLVYGNFKQRSFFSTIITGLSVAFIFSLLIAFYYPFLGPSAVSNQALVEIQQFMSNFQHPLLDPASQVIEHTDMSFLTFLNSKFLDTLFWLSGISFHNMIFIISGTVFLIVAFLIFLINRFRKSEEMADGVSMANTTNASIYGLILAFFVVTIFDSNQKAKENVDQEAASLMVLLKSTELFDNAAEIKEAIKNYIHFIVKEQWPLLCTRQTDLALKSATTSLNPIYKSIQACEPKNVAQEEFYKSLPKLLHKIDEAQHQRIIDSDIHLPVEFWRIIILMTLLTLILLVYANPWKGIETLFPILIPSLIICFCLGLIITFHYPFVGSFKISPEDYPSIECKSHQDFCS